jgi:hypothetical protein
MLRAYIHHTPLTVSFYRLRRVLRAHADSGERGEELASRQVLQVLQGELQQLP